MTYDYDPPAHEAFAALDAMVSALLVAQAEVRDLETRLAHANRRMRDIEERALPEMLDAMGLTEITTTGGLHVSIRRDIRASLPKEAGRRSAALAWFRANGHEGLIKVRVEVAFGRGEAADARRLADRLTTDGFLASCDETIHHQTLLAFLREQLRDGQPAPLDLVGAFEQRIATIKETM